MKSQRLGFGTLAVILGMVAAMVGCRETSSGRHAPMMAQSVPVLQAPESPAPVRSSPPEDGVQSEAAAIAAAPSRQGDEPAAPDLPEPLEAPPAQRVEAPEPKLPELSEGLREVIKLSRAGLAESVILSYITNSTNVYVVSSDEIVYLNDLGISSEVIEALIQKDVSEQNLEQKRKVNAVSPLPPEAVLNEPATNVYPASVTASNPVHVPPWPDNGDELAGAEVEVPEVPLDRYEPGEEVPEEVDYFYEPLAAYGTWYDTPEYGVVWQPTAAAIDYRWRPYAHNGRWLWTTQGWYWYSHYTWGWAPFHYGRWCVYPQVGWVWVPARVWAPAWVSWRYNKFYCGWAPLPPYTHYVSGYGLYYHGSSVGLHFSFGLGHSHYTYISYRHFYSHKPHHYYVPHHRKKGIHGQTTVINNYINGDNNTIINRGIGLEPVASVTRGEIPTVQVRNRRRQVGMMDRREQLIQDENQPVIVTPTPPPSGTGATTASASAPLSAQRGTLQPGRGGRIPRASEAGGTAGGRPEDMLPPSRGTTQASRPGAAARSLSSPNSSGARSSEAPGRPVRAAESGTETATSAGAAARRAMRPSVASRPGAGASSTREAPEGSIIITRDGVVKTPRSTPSRPSRSSSASRSSRSIVQSPGNRPTVPAAVPRSGKPSSVERPSRSGSSRSVTIAPRTFRVYPGNRGSARGNTLVRPAPRSSGRQESQRRSPFATTPTQRSLPAVRSSGNATRRPTVSRPAPRISTPTINRSRTINRSPSIRRSTPSRPSTLQRRTPSPSRRSVAPPRSSRSSRPSRGISRPSTRSVTPAPSRRSPAAAPSRAPSVGRSSRSPAVSRSPSRRPSVGSPRPSRAPSRRSRQ